MATPRARPSRSADEQGSGPESSDDHGDARFGKITKSSRLSKRSVVKLGGDSDAEEKVASQDEGEGEE